MRIRALLVLAVLVSPFACKKTRKEPDPNPPVLPAEWTACASDAECTFATLGCADVTPVNRAYLEKAHERLRESGRPYAAPKSACGPAPSGTWAGQPGVCGAGHCTTRGLM